MLPAALLLERHPRLRRISFFSVVAFFTAALLVLLVTVFLILRAHGVLSRVAITARPQLGSITGILAVPHIHAVVEDALHHCLRANGQVLHQAIHIDGVDGLLLEDAQTRAPILPQPLEGCSRGVEPKDVVLEGGEDFDVVCH